MASQTPMQQIAELKKVLEAERAAHEATKRELAEVKKVVELKLDSQFSGLSVSQARELTAERDAMREALREIFDATHESNAVADFVVRRQVFQKAQLALLVTFV